MRKKFEKLLILIMLLVFATSAGAVPITITNHSFEQPDIGDENYDWSSIPGWSCDNPRETGINTFEQATDGIWTCCTQDNDPFVYQVLSHTISAGTYELKADSKYAAEERSGELQLQLYYGSTTLASQSWIVGASHQTYTLTKVVGAGDPAIGQTLGIRFRNLSQSGKQILVVDNLRLTASVVDTDPPSPDPMTWASVPSADGESAISMTATTASDPSGVEYFFDETSGNPGGSDSGWQASTGYTDSGLNAATQYCYQV